MSNVTIKKAYKEIYELLESNSNKEVSTLMPQLIELMKAQQRDKTFITNDEGEVIAIFCYYHKKWELLDTIEYGTKKSSTHGFNTMCKEGSRQWTRQQKAIKDAKSELLDKVQNGEILVDELKEMMAQVEKDAKEVKPHSVQDASFDSIEELQNFLDS